jgi:hypothetical protein
MKHSNRYLFSLSALAGAALVGYAHEAYAICYSCGFMNAATSVHQGCYASTYDPFSDPYTYSGIKSGGGSGNCLAESYYGVGNFCGAIQFNDTQTHYGFCEHQVTAMRACRETSC